MKNRILLSLALVLAAISLGQSQAAITEGQIVMALTDVVTSDPQVKQVLSGSTLTIQSKNNVFRSKTNMMGDQINIENYYDLGAKDNRIYLNLMGQKILTNIPDSVHQRKLKELNENSIISYDTGDVKEINGFKCHKALVESLQEDGSVIEMHLYVTKEVAFPAIVVDGLPETLEGFPLEFKLKANGMEVTYSFKSYSEEVDADFSLEAEGFKTIPYDQFMEGIGKQLGLK